MLRSMYSGVSGLLAHQRKMDVIGNNIANVNTTAFKSSNVVFTEMFSQLVGNATQPREDGRGGTNPQQIGLGVNVGNISSNMGNGSIQSTDNPNDLAIDGEGFFVLTDGSSSYYSRAGNFTLDRDGNLVNGAGYKVMGWNQNRTTGNVDTSRPLSSLDFSNLKMNAHATESINLTGNISSTTLVYDSINDENAALHNITIYDSLGEAHTLTFKFMKTANNQYNFEISAPLGDMTFSPTAVTGNITFNDHGEIQNPTTSIPTFSVAFTNGAAGITFPAGSVKLDPHDFTQSSNSTSIRSSQDGYTSGELETVSIGTDGTIIGQFSNGLQEHVGSVALASFMNPNGLEKIGGSLFTTTWNSGEASIGVPTTGDRGAIATASLEMSNVDLATEFTEMILTQRGFQANSRIITVSDNLLEELVNLKR